LLPVEIEVLDYIKTTRANSYDRRIMIVVDLSKHHSSFSKAHLQLSILYLAFFQLSVMEMQVPFSCHHSIPCVFRIDSVSFVALERQCYLVFLDS